MLREVYIQILHGYVLRHLAAFVYQVFESGLVIRGGTCMVTFNVTIICVVIIVSRVIDLFLAFRIGYCMDCVQFHCIKQKNLLINHAWTICHVYDIFK